MVDEVVGRGIIEVVGDSSQLTASMAQAENAVEKFEDAAVSSAKNVGSAFSQTAAPVTAATDKIDAATLRSLKQKGFSDRRLARQHRRVAERERRHQRAEVPNTEAAKVGVVLDLDV